MRSLSALVEDKSWRRSTVGKLDVKVNVKGGDNSIAISFWEAQDVFNPQLLQTWHVCPDGVEEGGFSDKNATSESQLFQCTRENTWFGLRPKHAQVKCQLSHVWTSLRQACQKICGDKFRRLEESFFLGFAFFIQLNTAQHGKVKRMVTKEWEALLMHPWTHNRAAP